MNLFLYIFSFFLNIITSFRNFLYNKKILPIYSINIPVISIGNLELGGTGKTPVVLYLALFLSRNNFKPGIVSRGYKRTSSGQQLVTDGKKIFLSADEAGDEPFLLAQNLKNIPIVVNKDIAKITLFNNAGKQVVYYDSLKILILD